MRIAVIQSSFIPWRGYFDIIASVDKFVVYDDVQYSTGSWRNRNKLKTRHGLRWISVPVKSSLGLAIDEIHIGESRKPWREEHRRLLHDALGPAPFFDDAVRLWEDGVRPNTELLSEINVRLLRGICDYLGISTPLLMSRDYELQGAKTVRLIDLMKKTKATTYLSGPSAKNYLDETMFKESGIRLEYKTYDYEPYPQLWNSFDGAVTILDLIANCGADSKRLIRSQTPNNIVVE